MNIENVKALASQLEALGVINPAPALLRQICFAPEKFTLEHRVQKDADTFLAIWTFEKVSNGTEYVLRHYDVMVAAEEALPAGEVNGVSVPALEKEMQSIDWKKAFSPDLNIAIVLDDPESWKEEAQIAKVNLSLAMLEQTEAGKKVAGLLKEKFWRHLAPASLQAISAVSRDKLTVSQRFYVQNGPGLISLDEAYRFLQNKKWERVVRAKKDANSPDAGNDYSNTSSQNGPLQPLQKPSRGKQAGGKRSNPSTKKS